MKNDILIRIFFLLFISLLFTNCGEKKQPENLLEKVELKNCRITELTLPKGWGKTEKYEYTEGNVQTFFYSDNSFITIICGSLMNFETPEKKQVDKFWRQEKIMGKMIIYGNVTKERKMIFDKAFDEMKKQKK